MSLLVFLQITLWAFSKNYIFQMYNFEHFLKNEVEIK